MTDGEPLRRQIDAYLIGHGWNKRWDEPKVARWSNVGRQIRVETGEDVNLTISRIAIEEGRQFEDVKADILAGKFPERKPTEAELIVAALERRALDILDDFLQLRRDIEAAGRQPLQNSKYRRYSHGLDELAAALGDALWICAHGRARTADDEYYDALAAGQRRVRELRKAKEKNG